MEFSADDVLQHLAIQRVIRHQLAQLDVLVLEQLQPPHLSRRSCPSRINLLQGEFMSMTTDRVPPVVRPVCITLRRWP